MDYRGYGGNPGSPGRDGLAADADAAAAALTDLGYPPQRTVYFGESLGSAVVAALQVRHPPAGIVLRSPFTELADVGAHHYPWLPVRALLRDRFPVMQHLGHQRRAGHRHLRRPRLSGPHRAQRPRREPCPLLGRAAGDRGCRPQRPRHVRPTSARAATVHFNAPRSAADWRRPGDRRFPLTCAKRGSWIDERQLHRTSHRPANDAFARSPGRAGDASALDGVVLSRWGSRLRGVSLVWASSRLPLPGVRGSPSSRDAGRRVGRCCRRAAR